MFKNLRDRVMRIEKEYKPSKSGGGVPVEFLWPFFKQLQFLEPFIKYRATTSNINRSATYVSPSQEMTFTTVQEDSSLNVADLELSRIPVTISISRMPACQPDPFLSFPQGKPSTFSTPYHLLHCLLKWMKQNHRNNPGEVKKMEIAICY